MPTLLKRATLATAVVWLLLAVALDGVGDAAPAPSGPYDALVVAGCRVEAGGVASQCLEARTRRAVALWQAGVADRVIFTGGVGAHPPAEAEVAAHLARGLGLPGRAIEVEDESASTEDNARLAARLLPDGSTVLVVTDRYHVFRARRVFSRHVPGAHATGVTPPPWPRLRGSMREVLAVGWYWVNGRLAQPPAS
jgi:uncharacterized SAM-binding protein YcdF (DUF218 family)